MLIHTYPNELDLLALHQSNSKRYPFLLESVTQSTLSRYSILFAFPQETVALTHASDKNFLDDFDAAFKREQQPQAKTGLPFSGGWFVYLSYELAEHVEPTLVLPEVKPQLPIAQAVRIPAAVIVDHQKKQTSLICEQAFRQHVAQVKNDINALSLSHAEAVSPKRRGNIQLTTLTEDPAEKYLKDVEIIRDYIKAGDVFQVNYSREWVGVTQEHLTAAQLYQVLRERNPAPFAALCDFGDWAIISSSPERLVRVKDSIVETRPIAGTRPRSESVEADKALLDELIAHPKERAEHIMLIDLERNDLGRICQAGTVEVDELMGLETYQHVHHIVSNVRGRLQANISPSQVIRAVFPGGTITGCPKVHCMEIIAELEETGRGAYTGSVGYINHNGDMDFNILIRTLTQKGRELNFRTGAGIVFDSIPENELTETRDKAKGILRMFGNSF